MCVELTYSLAKSATKCVPGEGSADADIMFIGEAPGRDEDVSGRPFVGRSGQLLRKNIVRVGYKESDVFIGNVVKHRPPENRDPTPEEIEACRPFLDEQIRIIDPKLIVTVGRFSMGKFFPNEKISNIHGKVFKVTWGDMSFFVFPMYHPAAALRSTHMMQAFEHDFDKLPKIVEWVKNGGKTKEDEIKEALF
ncbi:uracil-DNA glycosylase [Candidatus Cerribacteria bacterium 'Amazon FNV 2010 28 9']|uniref:Type-4 uracil-DNA glycosylase n=1 Tax=Candidatus Cerribacteria bacterium 'Amazon FNV 2010 28 9' TaxID=2081795 RepID=A0A317JUE0_9BACT|nr:MAG: uracil-DNA glycosylase [Candidatus Cerribacteria bacterium 'Amazon FNV 2010 28 9']